MRRWLGFGCVAAFQHRDRSSYHREVGYFFLILYIKIYPKYNKIHPNYTKTHPEFTKIQSDKRSVEYEILNSLVSKTKDRQLSFDSKSTLLETDKQAYYTNSTVDAKVVVGNTDSSFKPKMTSW